MHPTIAQALKPFMPSARRDYIVTINGQEFITSGTNSAGALISALHSHYGEQMPERLSIHSRPMRSDKHSVLDHDPLAL